MRNVTKVLAAGMIFAFSTSVFANPSTPNVPAESGTFASLEVKAVQSNVQPGGLVSVDVYLNNAKNLAVFQLQVAATGGDKGSLTLENITVGKDRPDFVFAGIEVLDAVDMVHGRVGTLRFTGGTDVQKPVYLATFNFRASADAAGTFKLNLQHGEESFLNDSNAALIPHKKGADALVAVGSVTPTRVETRGGRK